MKKQLLLIAILFSTTFCFAQRVLTEEEEQSLLGSSTFLEKSQKAIRDYAAFWAINDGSTSTTEALKVKWAKDRILGVQIVQNSISDPLVSYRFIVLSKGTQFTLGTAPQPVATIIAAWDTAGTFAAQAGGYFDILGESINMTKTGN